MRFSNGLPLGGSSFLVQLSQALHSHSHGLCGLRLGRPNGVRAWMIAHAVTILESQQDIQSRSVLSISICFLWVECGEDRFDDRSANHLLPIKLPQSNLCFRIHCVWNCHDPRSSSKVQFAFKDLKISFIAVCGCFSICTTILWCVASAAVSSSSPCGLARASWELALQHAACLDDELASPVLLDEALSEATRLS